VGKAGVHSETKSVSREKTRSGERYIRKKAGRKKANEKKPSTAARARERSTGPRHEQAGA